MLSGLDTGQQMLKKVTICSICFERKANILCCNGKCVNSSAGN